MIYITAISLGLVGSLHCLGMCGPLALSAAQHGHNNYWQALRSTLWYHTGRLSTYIILGVLIGLVGEFVYITGVQKVSNLILGLGVLLYFVTRIAPSITLKFSILSKIEGLVSHFISSLYQRLGYSSPLVIGFINGLLPCGLVYVALAGALTTSDLLESSLFMLCFGLGTVPLLFTLSMVWRYIPKHMIARLRSLHLYFGVCFGLFLIYHAMDIGIPRELDFWQMLENPVMCH